VWFLYLDESGDLGFDFANKKPSKYFTVTILAIQGAVNNRNLINAAKKTLQRKLNKRKHRKRPVHELKGTTTTLQIKEYYYNQVKGLPFRLFSLTLNKRRVYERLTHEKDRVYNYVARLVLEKIRFENANVQIELIVDKSKSTAQIKEFNQYIFNQLKARIDPSVPLTIRHENSIQFHGLQGVDLFCWGIFRSYERNDDKWLSIFRKKIKYNKLFFVGSVP